MSSSDSKDFDSDVSTESEENSSQEEDFQSATASPEKIAADLIDDEAEGTDDESELDIPPTDSEESDDEDVAPIRSTRKSLRFRNRIESESEDSDEEVVALRKSAYAAHPDSDDEPIEDQAYSKSTRRSILGFVPKKSIVANTDDESEESDVIVEEDEEEEDRTASFVVDEENVPRKDESKEPSVFISHVDNSLEILEESSASIVDLTIDKPDSIKIKSEPKIKPETAPKVKTETRSPLKERQSNRLTISNESFDQSILEKMSSTLSIKADSIDEESVEVSKVRVSPSTYEAEQQAIDALQRKINSTMKILEMAHQLPDRGVKLKETIEANLKEIEKKQRLLATWEVDENLSIKNTIAKSFKSAQNSYASIDESVEEVKLPAYNNMPTTSKQAGVDVRDVQPKYFGKVGMQHFQQQKAATVDKLQKLQREIDTRPNEEDLETPPKYLKVDLMKHQLHAVKFMLWRESSNPRGGLLADDMGLGKTLTTISLIMKSIQRVEEDGIESDVEDSEDENEDGWKARGRKDMRDGGTLVVCPASLMKQWESEIKTKTKKGALETYLFHGPKRESRAKTLAKYDVVLTTYGLVTSDLKDEGCLFKIKWKRIILDEGHVIRNHKSKQSEAVCQLSAKYRWVLTGTPIHNKEFDMYAAIKFLRCHPFDELNYWKTWIQSSNGASSERLQTLLKSILLRRTKEQLIGTGEIKSLPDKSMTIIPVELSGEERQVYAKFLALSQSIFANFVKQQQERGERDGLSHEKLARMYKKFSSKFVCNREIKSHEILTLILRLRQCCCHPGLVKEAVENIDIMKENLVGDDSMIDHSTEDIMNKLQHLNIEDDPVDMDSEVFNLDCPSTKIEKVIEVLREKIVGTNDKAIVVSQWTSYLNIVRGMLEVEDIAYCQLTGEVPVKDRNDIVVSFNKTSSREKVMLLSLTAGGVGLNLVGANYLFLMDVHWNPQLEQQAQDRIYRFGQEKPVKIFKFICNNTIEGQILAKQEEKLATAESALTGAKKAAGSKLTMADLHKMFGMDDI